jgi:small subunit ribosomal protein S17
MEENREENTTESGADNQANEPATNQEGEGILVDAARAIGSVLGKAAAVVGLGGDGSDGPAPTGSTHRRQEKIGLVTSDKMQKTVVVRVERQIRHPKYKRYIRRRSKFMAHDEMGAGIGDIVRIVETRPLSARKRWRVVEIVQKAR